MPLGAYGGFDIPASTSTSTSGSSGTDSGISTDSTGGDLCSDCLNKAALSMYYPPAWTEFCNRVYWRLGPTTAQECHMHSGASQLSKEMFCQIHVCQ